MKRGPRDKQKNRQSDKENVTDREDKKPIKETSSGKQKKITNVPEDRPGRTDTSQERPDNPNPL